MKGLSMKKKVYIFLSAISFIYFIGIGLLNGFGVSMLPFWLFISIIFALLAYQDRMPWLNKLPYRLVALLKTCVLLLFGLFIIVEGFILYGMHTNAQSNLDCLIVLGTKVNGNSPSLALEQRLVSAYNYLKENPDTLVIVSGGQGSNEIISEAECMKNWLINKGINSSQIIMEDKSTTTVENLKYSFKYIREINKNEISVAVVTNNFHVFRSMSIAKKERERGGNKETDYKIYGISADCNFILMPHYMVREFFSLTVNWIKGNLSFSED